jgi:hypothetical protein
MGSMMGMMDSRNNVKQRGVDIPRHSFILESRFIDESHPLEDGEMIW